LIHLAPIPRENENAQLAAYAAAIEDGADRARAHWRGSDELDVNAMALPGQALLVQESYDPNWRAYVDGKPASIQRDAAGLMLLDLAPGNHSVRMVFETPREDYVGRALSSISVVLVVFLGCFWKRPH
jgi:hypothetical protein